MMENKDGERDCLGNKIFVLFRSMGNGEVCCLWVGFPVFEMSREGFSGSLLQKEIRDE